MSIINSGAIDTGGTTWVTGGNNSSSSTVSSISYETVYGNIGVNSLSDGYNLVQQLSLELHSFSDSISSSKGIFINDIIQLNSSYILDLIIRIIDEFNNNENVDLSITRSLGILEYIAFNDDAFIQQLEQLTESLSISYSLSEEVNKLLLIIEQLKKSDEVTTIQDVNQILVELISVFDSPELFNHELIQDNLQLVSAIINSINLYTKILLNTTLSISTANSLIYLNILSDNLSIDDLLNSNSISEILEQANIIFKVGGYDNNNEYISYLLEPETFSVSTYSNYNFTGSCKFNNEYLFINREGLYKYGGEMDEDNYITAKVQTSALDFNTSNLKQVPYFYIGVTNSNKLLLKLSVDGKATVYYRLNKKTQYLSNQKISIGKGLIGRYFQFELITEDNTDFNMESIEFTPLILKRKL